MHAIDRDRVDATTARALRGDEAQRRDVCAADDDRECWLTLPWFRAAQNADWCMPEVR